MIGIYPDFGDGGFWHGELIVESFFPRRAPNFCGRVDTDFLKRIIPESPREARVAVRLRAESASLEFHSRGRRRKLGRTRTSQG